MERKPDNRCEIQDAGDGRSRIMIRLKIMEVAMGIKCLAEIESGSLYETRMIKKWIDHGSILEELLQLTYTLLLFLVALNSVFLHLISISILIITSV